MAREPDLKSSYQYLAHKSSVVEETGRTPDTTGEWGVQAATKRFLSSSPSAAD